MYPGIIFFVTIFKTSPFKVTRAIRVVISSEKHINQKVFIKKRLTTEEVPIT